MSNRLQAIPKIADVKVGAPRSSSSHRLLKAILFRTFTIAMGVGVALMSCELALRIEGWCAPGFYVSDAGPLPLRDPGNKGGAFPPNTRGELRHYDYSVECVVNSDGFRDREVTSKQDGEWRIGFLGDSFTAGMGVQQKDRFADLFSVGLNANSRNVTVWNLGAPNCGTACEAAMLNDVKQRYQLDEIILAFYGGNDLEDNAAWYQADHEVPQSQSVKLEIKQWLSQHSRLATFVWINALRGFATFRPPGIYSQADLDRYWPSTERGFQALSQTVGANRLTVVYLPAPPEWNDDLWMTMRQRYHAADEYRHIVRDAVANWAQRHNVNFSDTTDSLKQCRPPADCLFPVDPHWTAKAHALVAKSLLAEPKWSGTNK